MVTPRIAISTRSDPFMSFAGWRQVCATSAIDQIDLDISNPIKQKLLFRNWSQPEIGLPKVGSVWIGKFSDSAALESNEISRLVIIPGALLLDPNGRLDSFPERLGGFQRRLAGSSRIALSILPVNREGSRAHLDRISAVRHVAEEWDVDLALDLTRAIDPRWEAEAAVLRMRERLRIVRLTLLADDSLPSFRRPSEQITRRVLASLVDIGYDGVLSLKVQLPWWNWSDPASASAEIARSAHSALTRFTSQPAEAPHPPRRVI